MVTAEFPGPSPQDLICSLLPFPSPSPPSVLQGLLTLPLFSGCEPVIIDLAHALAASDTHTHTQGTYSHHHMSSAGTYTSMPGTCRHPHDTHHCLLPAPVPTPRASIRAHSPGAPLRIPAPGPPGASLCLLHALRKLLPTAPQPLWVAHSHTLIPSPHLPWKSVF